jgi:hypothetical protein
MDIVIMEIATVMVTVGVATEEDMEEMVMEEVMVAEVNFSFHIICNSHEFQVALLALYDIICTND